MVLEKEKSSSFKKFNGKIVFKKGILCFFLAGTLMLSGCVSKNNQNDSEVVDNENKVVKEEISANYSKIYETGEHRVFVIRNGYAPSLSEKVYMVSNIETPEGYQLVNTDYENIFEDQYYLAVINEYVNIVPVKVDIFYSNGALRETEFGTPIVLEEETEDDKVLNKTLQ